MTESEPKQIRWGVLATGGIAGTFVKDLLIDPLTRGTSDVSHVVVAVASSSSVSSAETFIAKFVTGKQTAESKAYGSYEQLVEDPNVDIVYVATPHSHHYQNCMLALANNKPVVCEKALTVNAAQAKILYNTAKERNLFFMEAVWTRYFPLSKQVRQWITDGEIGEVLRVQTDLSIGADPEKEFGTSSRMVNKDLAGGALLDLGIYSLTWAFQTVYHTLPADQRAAPRVVGAVITPYPQTGADELTTMLLEFPKSAPSARTKTHAIATTSLRLDTKIGSDTPHEIPAVRVSGEKGEIQVYGHIFRPKRVKLISKDGKGAYNVEDKTFDFPGNGHGMFWEADEAARCLTAGKLESEGMPWKESLVIMEVMDEVRRQGGLQYPDEIETTQYPTSLKGRAT